MRPGVITSTIEFIKEAHAGQVRKYTGEDYYTHPLAVARCIAEYVKDFTPEQILAALLHDVVEDTPYTLDEIKQKYGDKVAEYVYFLSDVSKPEDGNRKTRKRLDREHIAKAPAEVKTVKLADLIDNTKSIVAGDKHFAEVYLAEKVLLLEVLTAGDEVLHKMACDQVVIGLLQARHDK